MIRGPREVFHTNQKDWIPAAGTSRLIISTKLVRETYAVYCIAFILCVPLKKGFTATADKPNWRNCRPMIRGHFRTYGGHFK